MERTLASQQDFQCRGESHHHHLNEEEKAWDRDRSSALLHFSFETLSYELLSISLLVFLFYVVRHLRLFLLNNFYFDILHLYNIVIPIRNSVTSVKLKKTGTWNGQPKYWLKKQYML